MEIGAKTPSVARLIFWSWDFAVGVGVGVVVAFAVGQDPTLSNNAVAILLANAAAGIAVLAVALTALAILVGMLGDAYLQILERVDGGVRFALLPYKSVSAIGAAGALSSLVSLSLWGVPAILPIGTTTLRAIALGVPTLLTAWAVAGTVQLVNLTAFHGVKKSDLLKGIAEARRIGSTRPKSA